MGGRRALAAAAAFALTAALLPGRASAQEKVTVLLDYPYPEGIHAALQLAAQKGWFKEQGLDVDIIDGKGSGTTVQQVAGGQDDIGLAQLSTMATAVSNGVPVTSIMGIARKGDIALVVATDTGVKTLKDLKGKKIAAPAGSGAVSLLDAFLKAGGITRDDMNLVTVDSSALISSYISRVVDGVLVTTSYFLPLVGDQRPATIISYADVGLSVPSYGLVVKTSMLDARPEMLRKMVAVNQRAWTYILAGHEQEGVDAIVAQRAAMKPDAKILLGMLKLNLEQFETPATKGKPIGWQADADWQEALRVMEAGGLVKPGWKVADFYTNRFIGN